MTQFLLALPVLLLSVVAHEYAHGYAALRQGDLTALRLGRLTLNPLKHIDPWMSILLPALLWYGSSGGFVFGGAKPVPVDPRNYKSYRRGDIIVSSAGIVMNLCLFAACVILSICLGLAGGALPALHDGLSILQRMTLWGIWLNALLAFFNLIPIPPLDGSHLFYHLLPPEIGAKYRALSRYGFLILLALLVFFRDIFSILLLPALAMTFLAFSLVGPFALQPLPF
ncbi:MAG: site-2 protease family protein [Gemmatimonadota bacterium]|nr:MAG: site-2 protease family protein [Gemmatimonadota bacterium]